MSLSSSYSAFSAQFSLIDFSKFDYQNNPSSTLQVRIIRRARAVTLRDIYTGVAKQVFNIISI